MRQEHQRAVESLRNVEASFSHQQRGLSEITSEGAQALEAQRHTLAQQAVTELMRGDTRYLASSSSLCLS